MPMTPAAMSESASRRPLRDISLHRDYAVIQSASSPPRRVYILALRPQASDPHLRNAESALPDSGVLRDSGCLEAYVHWVGADPRLDCWINTACIIGVWPEVAGETRRMAIEEMSLSAFRDATRPKRRARESESLIHDLNASGVAAPNESREPRQITSVVFGWVDLKTWYDSPYQFEEVCHNLVNSSARINATARFSPRPSSRETSWRSTLSRRTNGRKRIRLTGQAVDTTPDGVKEPICATDLAQCARDCDHEPSDSHISARTSPGAVPSLDPDLPADKAIVRITKRSSSSSGSDSTLVARSLLPQASEGYGNVASMISSSGSAANDAATSKSTSASASHRDDSSALPPPALQRILPSSGSPVHLVPRIKHKCLAMQGRGAKGHSAPKAAKKGIATFSPQMGQVDYTQGEVGFGDRASTPDSDSSLSALYPSKRTRQHESQLVPSTGQHLLQHGRIYVCNGCFKYMAHLSPYEMHHRICKQKYPPGCRIWQRGSQTIWEIDGAKAKLWCQNLCLFAKLFIDHKYVFFDVEGFLFYVLCEGDGQRDYMMGFFSKEKISYDDYNLACIVILPHYQKRGYGSLLIELSYELYRRTERYRKDGIAGTPERPLSDLGLRSYLAYWTSVLIRYFRRLVIYRSVEVLQRIEQQEAVTMGRRKIKRHKGWVSNQAVSETQESIRTKDSAGHATDTAFTIKISISEVAIATGLRADDAALALRSCGLLRYLETDEEGKETLVIVPEAIERIACERQIRPPLLEIACMLAT